MKLIRANRTEGKKRRYKGLLDPALTLWAVVLYMYALGMSSLGRCIHSIWLPADIVSHSLQEIILLSAFKFFPDLGPRHLRHLKCFSRNAVEILVLLKKLRLNLGKITKSPILCSNVFPYFSFTHSKTTKYCPNQQLLSIRF